MLELKANRQYKVIDIYPESGFYAQRFQIIGYNVRRVGRTLQSHPHNLSVPKTHRSSMVHIINGPWRGKELYLKAFRAHLLDHREVCYCSAYPFPHTAGGGKCPDADEPVAICNSCGLRCTQVYVDFGIGPYEFWGERGFHSDWRWVSNCCESSYH